MAPNNALAAKDRDQNKGVTKTTTTTTINGTTGNNTTVTKTSSSSILDKGTVEERGHGSKTTVAVINKEIQDFLIEGNVSLVSYKFWFDEIRCFFTVWTFLTRLPGPTFVDHHPGYLMRGMIYFPLIGSLIGIWISTFYCFATTTLTLSPLLSSSIALASTFWLTGCFHEDGLGDTADGFGGGWSSSQILKIMTDTRLGTYGCVVLIIYIITKVHLYAELGKQVEAISLSSSSNDNTINGMLIVNTGVSRINTITNAIVISQTVSRLIAVYMIKKFNYIDESDGPKTTYYHFMISAKYLVSYQRLLLSIVYCYLLTILLYKSYIFATILIITILIAGHCAGVYSTYIINGIIGDYLGASICVAEIIILAFVSQHETIHQFVVSSATVSFVTLSSYDTISTISINNIISYMQTNEQWQVCFQFTIMILLCIVWCKNVGHPDVLVRDIAIQNTEAEQSDNDCVIHIGMNINSKNNSTDQNSTSPSVAVATITNPLFDSIEEQLKNKKLTFAERYDLVREYIDTLAKPVGSLGLVEEWAAKVGAVQCTLRPSFQYQISSTTPNNKEQCSSYYSRIACCIFCADHGMAADTTNGGENCSAYPQAVSRSILRGIELDGAGVCVLAKANNVHLHVVDVGVIGSTIPQEREYETTTNTFSQETTTSRTICSFRMEESNYKLLKGTKNACNEPAMTISECEGCIQAGRDTIQKLHEKYSTMVHVLGEIGIGNTTTSSLLLAACLGLDGSDKDKLTTLCDGGATTTRTIDTSVVANKIATVQKALLRHKKDVPELNSSCCLDPISLLATFGGAEIAALVGAMLCSSDLGCLIVIDGFIVTVAAAVASSICPECTQYMLFASRSTERGYQAAFDLIMQNATKVFTNFNTVQSPNSVDSGASLLPSLIQSKPALDMNLRMGEGTAGLLTIPILRNSIDVLNNMLTIQEILSTPS